MGKYFFLFIRSKPSFDILAGPEVTAEDAGKDTEVAFGLVNGTKEAERGIISLFFMAGRL